MNILPIHHLSNLNSNLQHANGSPQPIEDEFEMNATTQSNSTKIYPLNQTKNTTDFQKSDVEIQSQETKSRNPKILINIGKLKQSEKISNRQNSTHTNITHRQSKDFEKKYPMHVCRDSTITESREITDPIRKKKVAEMREQARLRRKNYRPHIDLMAQADILRCFEENFYDR